MSGAAKRIEWKKVREFSGVISGVCTECGERRLTTACWFYPCRDVPKSNLWSPYCYECLPDHYVLHKLAGDSLRDNDTRLVTNDLHWAEESKRRVHVARARWERRKTKRKKANEKCCT